MGFLDFFKLPKLNQQKVTTWNELGTFRSIFTPFGNDIYASDLIRDCLRPLAEHTSKANARCSSKDIERLLNDSPNVYMNGKAFLAKVRTMLEIKNTAFIYIKRNDIGRPVGFYPVPYSWFEELEYNGRLFIKFYFNGALKNAMVLPWDDLAVLRKDYNKYDVAGDENDSVLEVLELNSVTRQGVANAVKSTANLRGIIKSTKAMLSDVDIKKNKERFVADYLNLSNEGGIASLDSTQEFTPIKMEPAITSWEQQREFREDVYRYFGVNESIITSNYTEAQMEAFYESRIEPFLVDLSMELTRKCFTDRERAFGNAIIYESNRMQYASNSTKLAMVALVDRGALTPNEWRFLFNLAPVEGGDVPIRRLDTAVVDEEPKNDNTEDKDDGNS